MTDDPKPINLLERPQWAAYIWSDDTAIWLELPCPVGKNPVLVQYAKTEGGLHKALALVDQCCNINRKPPMPGHYKAYHEERPRPPHALTPKLMDRGQAMKDTVARALRKAGL